MSVHAGLVSLTSFFFLVFVFRSLYGSGVLNRGGSLAVCKARERSEGRGSGERVEEEVGPGRRGKGWPEEGRGP